MSCCTYPNYDFSQLNTNINRDPMLVDPENGDFRLRKGSPCIDAGNSAFVTTGTDYSGKPRIQNNRVDMGAIEGSVELYIFNITTLGRGGVTPSGRIILTPGTNVLFSATATGIGFSHYIINGVRAGASSEMLISNVRRDMTITAVFKPETLYVDASRLDDTGAGVSWGTAKKTMQSAFNAAYYKDTICVTNGIYPPFTMNYEERYLTVKSINGAEATIIDGNNTERCAQLSKQLYLY